MAQRPKRFTYINTHPVICVMLQAIGIDLDPKPLKVGEMRICLHEHVNILVKRDTKDPAFVVITTVNGTYLLTISFEEADVLLQIAPREKSGVMELPEDLSLLNALKLYFDMRAVVNDYIFQNFNVKSVPELMKGITYINRSGVLTQIS